MSTSESAMQSMVSNLIRRALPTAMTGAPIHRIFRSGKSAERALVTALSESTNAALCLLSVEP